MDEKLSLPALPDFPQMRHLPEIAGRLWKCPDVRALWLGGSFGAGTADALSDVDIRAAVDPASIDAWTKRDLRAYFGDEYVEGQAHDFVGNGILHHFIGASGTLYDLWILDPDIGLPGDRILLLGCRDEALRGRLDQIQPMPAFDPLPADAAAMRQLLVDYWIATSKHAKVIARDLPIVVHAGLEVERTYLLRLWYAAATGLDSGTGRVTIHLLSRMLPPIKVLVGDAALEILGAPLRSHAELITAIERNRGEVARVGRILAERLGFDYPERLESVVRAHWQASMGRP